MLCQSSICGVAASHASYVAAVERRDLIVGRLAQECARYLDLSGVDYLRATQVRSNAVATGAPEAGVSWPVRFASRVTGELDREHLCETARACHAADGD